MEKLEELGKQIQDAQDKIKKISNELNSLKENQFMDLLKAEEQYLKKRFNFVMIILTSLIVLTALTIGLDRKSVV